MLQVHEALALHGGPKAIDLTPPAGIFRWPVVTAEDEAAVLEVLRAGTMSGNDVTKKFEKEYAEYHGVPYALGYCNGTASLQGAMWACGVGAGDEVIAPSVTYWASALPALSLGASIQFADIDPNSLCICPKDFERRISPRTKAVVVVHLYSHPAAMDEIMAIARRHDVKVIEDVSHAHGALYKGKPLGTIGDVGCFSLMSGKTLPAGEAGMLITSQRKIWERAIAFGFYERTGKSRYAQAEAEITDPELQKYSGLPLGGCKHRMNQTCAAMGRVQLRHFPERMRQMQDALNYFWDHLEDESALRPHRVRPDSGSTMGGWYAPAGHYVPEALNGLPIERFCEAARAEGIDLFPLGNRPLHLHPMLQHADIYNHGRPTQLAHSGRTTVQGAGSLPVAEAAPGRVLHIPKFYFLDKGFIGQYVRGIKKVIANAQQLR